MISTCSTGAVRDPPEQSAAGRRPGRLQRAALVPARPDGSDPSCAYHDRWACPLAPPENRVDVPLRAGERAWHD
ncbi:DUF1684 domain-containing protein [Micromonospora sp. NPDC049282]|uniref:DUF1684 domain-containing protein n=1 Tax=Micromonospora sp. NPDC049282 TaxID=3364269 RepID=UPI00371238EA